jgi:hypothetical protein
MAGRGDVPLTSYGPERASGGTELGVFGFGVAFGSYGLAAGLRGDSDGIAHLTLLGLGKNSKMC